MLFLLTIYTLCDSSDLKYEKQREYFILKTRHFENSQSRRLFISSSVVWGISWIHGGTFTGFCVAWRLSFWLDIDLRRTWFRDQGRFWKLRCLYCLKWLFPPSKNDKKFKIKLIQWRLIGIILGFCEAN